MIEIALVGAGRMGASHFRVAAGLRDARIVAIVDEDLDRARTVAAETDVAVYDDVSAVLTSVDAAIVATPTATHARIASRLLASGVHVLVEKPLAGDLAEAASLVAAADVAQRILMVGHVERFNPVVLELESLSERPLFLETSRVSPFTEHVPEGVVLDLMVHDIDIALAIVNSPVSDVVSRSLQVRGGSEDAAWAIIEFQNGVIAQLTASRLGQEKVRKLVVTEADRVFRGDLIRQDISIHRVTGTSFSSSGYREAGIVEIPYLQHRGEPLFLEQWSFVEAVLGRRPVRAPGADGLRALQVAHQILEAART
jgi:predicted dehydrogenase